MSYESAMEERILKTFKSKDNLIRKQQAQIDEMVEMLENMVFNANIHHNDARELLKKYDTKKARLD